MPITIKNLPKEEITLQPGHAACPGCPIGIGLRIVGKVLGKKTVIVIPACCTSIVQGPYPYSAVKVPLVNVIFAASAAVASGIAGAFEAQGIKDAHVVVWAGDGGTADIGLQALSGAAERNDNIIYICYDNEAYMNTGIQRSGSTPYKAWTTTTITGKTEFKKNMPAIIAQHRVPYVATASIGYPLDFAEKLQKASKIKGFKYIHLLAPCPVGWRFDPSLTAEMGKLAVLTGLWPLYEVEYGVFKLTGVSLSLVDKDKRVPLEKYLRLQGRFKHITDEDIKIYEEYVDQLWRALKDLHGKRIV